ncbi:uncharacterized protein LAESUDRAFT_761365 [Laetiporus sulphureus 93-53]|uniref:Uncharacterized protein n=1 Tax=Laetiporus sulphureus 93-53 TaxID=1314785 RepID=A0A165D6K2_9APHY|nr:uncharacterized protein LAESUDRAFT_761365 [Laetiporus sulphureus 93-53]KZT04247.1 hypothetical protein LAESUDRAFT_761365 [Laetiporus sulphureus 93-53]
MEVQTYYPATLGLIPREKPYPHVLYLSSGASIPPWSPNVEPLSPEWPETVEDYRQRAAWVASSDISDISMAVMLDRLAAEASGADASDANVGGPSTAPAEKPPPPDKPVTVEEILDQLASSSSAPSTISHAKSPATHESVSLDVFLSDPRVREALPKIRTLPLRIRGTEHIRVVDNRRCEVDLCIDETLALSGFDQLPVKSYLGRGLYRRYTLPATSFETCPPKINNDALVIAG